MVEFSNMSRTHVSGASSSHECWQSRDGSFLIVVAATKHIAAMCGHVTSAQAATQADAMDVAGEVGN